MTVDSKNLHEIGRLNSSDKDFDIVGVVDMWTGGWRIVDGHRDVVRTIREAIPG